MTHGRPMRLPPNVIRAMMETALSGDDAPRQKPQGEGADFSDPEEQKLAEEFVNGDPTLSNDVLCGLEDHVSELARFIGNQVELRQGIERTTLPDARDQLDPSRRHGILQDLLEVEQRLGRVLELLSNVSTRERQHYGEGLAAVLTKNARDKRVRLNDWLAGELRRREEEDEDERDADESE